MLSGATITIKSTQTKYFEFGDVENSGNMSQVWLWGSNLKKELLNSE